MISLGSIGTSLSRLTLIQLANTGSIIELSPGKPVLVSLHAEALQPLSEHLDKQEPADVTGGTARERFVSGVISKITPKRCEIRIEALDMVLDWQAWRIKAYLQSPTLQEGQIEIRKEVCEAFAVTANPSPSTSPTRATPISRKSPSQAELSQQTPQWTPAYNPGDKVYVHIKDNTWPSYSWYCQRTNDH